MLRARSVARSPPLLVAVAHPVDAAEHHAGGNAEQCHAGAEPQVVPPLLEVGGVVRAVQVSLGRVLEELLGGLELVLGVHQAVHEAAALLTHLGRGAAGEGAERVHGPEGRLSLRSILGVRWTTHGTLMYLVV